MRKRRIDTGRPRPFSRCVCRDIALAHENRTGRCKLCDCESFKLRSLVRTGRNR